MSKYLKIQTQFKDEAALIEALQACGFEFECGEALALYGYQGDARPEKAEIVIRRHNISSCANDLGFARQPDGSYGVIISEFDSRNRGAEMVKQAKQKYARIKVERMAKARGLEVREVSDNGSIRLQLVQPKQSRTRRELRVGLRR